MIKGNSIRIKRFEYEHILNSWLENKEFNFLSINMLDEWNIIVHYEELEYKNA